MNGADQNGSYYVSLRTEIYPFRNIDGYISGSPVHGLGRTNDNAILFTALYFITLKLRNEDTYEDALEVKRLVTNITHNGVLLRYPGDFEVDDSFDNYVAYAALCVHYKLRWLMFKTVLRMSLCLGFLNASGKFTRNAFIFRFLALSLCAFPAAMGLPSPFNAVLGYVIGNSNKGESTDAVDNRKNLWLLIQAMKNSYFCRRGAERWITRMNSDYAIRAAAIGTTPFRAMLLAYFLNSEYPPVKYGVPTQEKK